MADTAPAARERAKRALGLSLFLQRVLIVAAVVVLALLLWQWRHALLLLFASILIACGLDGLAAQLRRFLPLGPKLSVALAGLCVILVLGSVGFFFGRQIGAQIATLSETLPRAWQSLAGQVGQYEIGRQALTDLRSAAGGDNLLGDLTRRVGQFGFTFASGALDGFLVIVGAIFLALDPKSYRDGVLALIPHEVRGDGREALDTSGRALKKWLAGTLVSMVAIMVMIGAGLWALGVPAALALALIAGLAQFVPFIGPLLSALPAILLAFTVSPATAGWVALLYFAASTIEANILYPLIQKRAVQQPPVLTLFSVIAFGLLFGSLGAVLAVPITVVITVFVIVFYVRGALGEEMKAPGEPR